MQTISAGIEPVPLGDYWGKELTINASNCHPDRIKDADLIKKFSKELVEKIGMVAYGEPQTPNFGSGEKEGITLVQLIETSNITAHFANTKRAIFLNCFSCADYDENIVIKMVVDYFYSTHIEHFITLRDA